MASKPEIIDLTDEDDIDLDADAEDQQDNDADDEAEGSDDEADPKPEPEADPATEDADEDVISFGGAEVRGEDEPEHIGELRRMFRDEKRRRIELEAQLAPKIDEQVGPKPNLDDYWEKDDPQGEFERDLLAWNDRKVAGAKHVEQQREAAQAAQREYETDVADLEAQRAGLKVRDFDAAYDRVAEKLDDAQRAILVQVAKNKAALMYALGKNPDRLDQIAKITNYAKFAGEVARLDMETRVSRKPTTRPEGVVRGAGTFSGRGAADAKLDRLEKEADETGNRSKLHTYRRTLKAAGRG